MLDTQSSGVINFKSEGFAKALTAIQNNDLDDAIELLKAEAKANPTDADIQYTLGRTYKQKGEAVKAIKALIEVAKIDKTYHPAYFLLGQLYFSQGMGVASLESYAQAVAYDVGNSEYKQNLVNAASAQVFKRTNNNLRGVLIHCLEDDSLDFTYFGRTWLKFVSAEPNVGPFYKLSQHKTYSAFEKAMQSFDNLDNLIEVFFLTGLGKFVILDTTFETWCTYLRRYLLESMMQGKALFTDPDDWALMTCALSKFSFFTDYILGISESEQKHVDELRADIQKTATPDLHKLGLLACYERICLLENAADIAKNLQGGDHVSQIPKSQIEEYLRQEEIKKTIKAATSLDDAVSLKVQEQYEDFPYPRWVSATAKGLDEPVSKRFVGQAIDILIAGCGTGREAVLMAYNFPDAKITAVDLSKTSLAYAIDRAAQLGIENIEFAQGDINNLKELNKTFDYIASAGVLHHMADPKAGWSVLNDILKPGGLMRLALYSKHARWAINDARTAIADKKISNDAQSIIDFRHDIDAHVKYKSRKNIEHFYDYYTLTECRDLLFHVQEYQYDLPEIKTTLDGFGHKFLGFMLPNDQIQKYKKRNPEDANATDLERWAQWEEKNQNLFSSMYVFWSEKS